MAEVARQKFARPLDRTQDGGSSLWGQAAARLLLRPLFRGSLPYWTIGASSDKLSVARERVVTH